MNIFETYMLMVVAYSCFSSAYFTAFDFPSRDDNKTAFWLENLVFGSFALDMFFTFFKIPENIPEDKLPEYTVVAKAYMKSGQFFLDLLATFPFYLFDDDKGGNQQTVWIKLIRLVRIPRIVNLLDLSRFNKFVENVFKSQTRGKRVVF